MKKKHLDILLEDEHIVVINKAAGLLSIGDRYNEHAPSVVGMLRADQADVMTVHRLDRDTSGVMVFAKNPEAHKHLNTQFENRTVRKHYHAVVSGIFREDELAVDIPIAPNPGKKGLMMPTVRGKEALSIFRPLQCFRMATLLDCDLRTGRQHQIRVHCSAIGYPLLVDPDYGEHTEFLLSTIKRRYNLGRGKDERPIIARLTLHSHSLAFLHPVTEQEVEVQAEYPKDFRALIQVLEKYASYREVPAWERQWGLQDEEE